MVSRWRGRWRTRGGGVQSLISNFLLERAARSFETHQPFCTVPTRRWGRLGRYHTHTHTPAREQFHRSLCPYTHTHLYTRVTRLQRDGGGGGGKYGAYNFVQGVGVRVYVYESGRRYCSAGGDGGGRYVERQCFCYRPHNNDGALSRGGK